MQSSCYQRLMEDLLTRVWDDLLGRVDGPLKFRLIIQPIVVLGIACRAGLKDADSGRPAYGFTILANPAERGGLLREGWRDIARVFIFAVIFDVIYEVIVLGYLYPGESLIVATTVAVLPYLFIRSFVNLIVCRVRRWRTTAGTQGFGP
jgi:hypothetical protein